MNTQAERNKEESSGRRASVYRMATDEHMGLNSSGFIGDRFV